MTQTLLQNAKGWGLLSQMCLILLISLMAIGQEVNHSGPQFAAMSIKPHEPNTPIGGLNVWPGGLEYRGATLYECIKSAYGFADYQLGKITDPLVIGNRFDIVAKSEKPATRHELLLMLRNGLADRCNLKLRTEKQDSEVLFLRKTKVSPRLAIAPVQAQAGQRIGIREVTFTAATMADLADFLGTLASIAKPVLDRTDLTERFNFVLRMTNVSVEPPAAYDEHVIYEWDTIRADVQELGLRLVRGRSQITVVRIDHISSPSEN